MKTPHLSQLAKTAVLVIAEIKDATEAFDRGDTSACETLGMVATAIEAYRAAARPRREAA